jgi:uncharacterized protein YcfJ
VQNAIVGVALLPGFDPRLLLETDPHTADVYRQVLSGALRERQEDQQAHGKWLAAQIGQVIGRAFGGGKKT